MGEVRDGYRYASGLRGAGDCGVLHSGGGDDSSASFGALSMISDIAIRTLRTFVWRSLFSTTAILAGALVSVALLAALTSVGMAADGAQMTALIAGLVVVAALVILQTRLLGLPQPLSYVL